jgi:hypothetical protein
MSVGVAIFRGELLQIFVQVQGHANGGERGQITGETTMIEDNA